MQGRSKRVVCTWATGGANGVGTHKRSVGAVLGCTGGRAGRIQIRGSRLPREQLANLFRDATTGLGHITGIHRHGEQDAVAGYETTIGGNMKNQVWIIGALLVYGTVSWLLGVAGRTASLLGEGASAGTALTIFLMVFISFIIFAYIAWAQAGFD